jgi:hypothetical protein
MATRRRPGSEADPVQASVSNALNDNATTLNMAADLLQVRQVETTVVQPYLSSIIPNLIADVRPSPQNIIARSDSASQVITVAKMLRGLVFVNYMATPLYLQIHGVTPAPAAAVLPAYPPIPIAQNQVLVVDQALLGYDGFGYTDCTIRVSTSPTTYTPTAATPGLWAMIARFK